MSYNINDAFLADKVYGTNGIATGTVLVSPDGTRWILALKSPDLGDGYQGALFRKEGTTEFRFASRGTELKREPIKDVMNADLQMAFNRIPDQMVSQRQFFAEAKKLVTNANGLTTEIKLIGDSLGGSLVTLLGVENPHNQVSAFNPYGVGNLIPEGTYENITSHVMARDPVSVLPGSKTIGKTLMYTEPENTAGETSPDMSSHTNRSLWQRIAVWYQEGQPIEINAYSPMNWRPGPDGAGLQGDPFTGLPWPTATDVTPSGNGYTFQGTSTAGAGRGFINPDLVRPPSDLGTASRNSAAFIAGSTPHAATIRQGGTLSDLWFVQRNNQTGFTSAREFYLAVLAGNPHLKDVNDIPAGTTINVPQRTANGWASFTLANGLLATVNIASGEANLQMADLHGGFVTWIRETADDIGYNIRQITTDAGGNILEEMTAYQAGRDAPLQFVTRRRTSDDAAFDAWGGFDPFSHDHLFTEDEAGEIVVNAPPAPIDHIGILFNAEERFQREYNAGFLSADRYYAFQDFTINYSLTQGTGTGLGSGSGLGLQPPSGGFWSDPIGAFYDSQSAAFDHAASIAAHTGVLLDANQRRLGPRQFSFLDIDSDGSLHASETVGLSLWRDLNENGRADTGEIIALADSGLGPIDRKDWALRAQGQPGEDTSPRATAHLSPGAPAEPLRIQRMTPLVLTSTPTRPLALSLTPPSNYRQLRDSYNVYAIPDGRLINWTASQVKINFNSTDVLIGTDGNDAFDVRYYSAYATWFQLALLTRFPGGGGNDIVGGSSRADSLWGGTGNDTLWGYEGNDKLYGEEDQDELIGQAGDDLLDGGIGNDRLFGGVGNDALYGGEGDDILLGFNPSNDGRSTLLAGETDNDVLHGGNGHDTLYGALGQDTLDGGSGNDALLGEAGNDQLWGGDGNDELQGGDGDDALMGEAGDDALFGQSGNDTLRGGAGNDVILGFTAVNEVQQTLQAGQTDDDLVFGEDGDDDLRGGLGRDILDGGTGHDELQGGDGHDMLLGGYGDDRLFGQVGNDSLWGGEGHDVLVGFTASNEAQQALLAGQTDDDQVFGEGGNDDLHGFAGKDSLDGGTGDDLLNGGDGDDLLFGGDGFDELQGGQGSDQLVGGLGEDRMFGQVGNDTLWGGDGDDLLYGFTGTNEAKQSLTAGETDDDLLIGGAGSDILVAGIGSDTLHGGTGRDELQGNAGNDLLFGEEGDDNLFGQAGDDQLQGGEGDDFLMGFTASNEAQQALAEGETDNDRLYGGAGSDTLVGAWGDDWLDGGAGADMMAGGAGNDTYVVNSVNDVAYEAEGEGHDVVYASTTRLLSAQVEDLHLLEGFAIHGTGNARDNLITGNGSDNILDGVTGADTMAGGHGNDTYYLDDAGDRVIEQAGQGTDTVQSSISHTLGEHLENLILLDFSKPEHGLVDGREVRVYGYPKRNELDYMQGDAVAGFQGTCALTSIANVLTQMGRPTTESQVVTRAIDNGWTVNDPALPAWRLGGSNIDDQRALLDSYGVRHQALLGYNEAGLANLLRGGRGVVVALNAGALWDEAAYQGSGGVNHAVTLSGAVHANDTGELVCFYLSDSGRGLVNDMTRFVDIATFRAAADVAGAYALFTLDPVKLWDEDIDATGNAGDNTLAGNRGHNRLAGGGGQDVLLGEAGDDVLDGGAGDDTLAGGTGNDTYRFGLGGGHDRVVQADARLQDHDVLQLGAGIDFTRLWVSRSGNDLAIDIRASTDRVTMADWFTDEARRVDQIRTSDGWSLAQRDVQQLVDAMAAFAPADAVEARIDARELAMLAPVLAASWQAG